MLYSCYPTYSIQSGKALEKGKVSGSLSLSSPVVSPALALRLGLGQNVEISAKSSYLSNELGLKHALKEDQTKSYQHALGITIGNTLFSKPIKNQFYYDVSYEGDSTLQQKNENVAAFVFTLPYYMSLHNKKDFLRVYGKLAPTFSKSIGFDSFGLMTTTGLSIGKKISINTEIYFHLPFSTTHDIFNETNPNTLTLYNIGFQVGVVFGQF